jgi:hypothetical protein
VFLDDPILTLTGIISLHHFGMQIEWAPYFHAPPGQSFAHDLASLPVGLQKGWQ